MQFRFSMSIVPLLCFAVPAAAQEGEMPAMPKPAAQHELLKDLAGTWRMQIKHWAQPGGAPETSEATEEAKLACGGFWLVTKFEGNFADTPFAGRGVTGYDPDKKKYVTYWVDSMSPRLTTGEGDYDAKTKTMTMTLQMPGPDGQMQPCKSVCVFKDRDTRVEKMLATGADGKEVVMMEMTATRVAATADKTVEASMRTGDKGAASKIKAELADQHQFLKPHAGQWDAAVEMTMPGADAPEKSTGTATEILDCGGLCVLGEFRGEFMGSPFEGREILGYDPIDGQFFSVWIDSCSPHAAVSRGRRDSSGVLSLEGSCIGMDGKPTKSSSSVKWEGENKRVMTMKSKTADGKDAGTLVVTYTRRS